MLFALAGFSLLAAHQSQSTRNWNQSLEVTVFPINADGHAATTRYIDKLSNDTFLIINQWGVREAARHNLKIKAPLNVRLGEQIDTLPPPFPMDASAAHVLIWGLKFRWWAFRHSPDDGGELTRVRLFVMYHEGEEDRALAHSLGMQKGLMGLVHAFADPNQTQQNNVIIAHEILHTVGASDKYHPSGNPLFPIGFANPQRTPLFPQRSAEVMAGRIPTSHQGSYMAESLRSVSVNRFTAQEINWLKPGNERKTKSKKSQFAEY